MLKTFFLVGYICSYAVSNYIDPYCSSINEQFDTLEECKQQAIDYDLYSKVMAQEVLTRGYFQCLVAEIRDEI